MNQEESSTFSKNVFINCPFDDEYKSLLRPLLFSLLYLGYIPRIALESSDSLQQRITKITALIEDSKFSIHDLSRSVAPKNRRRPRLNMPFEMGIDYGCRLFKEGCSKDKRCLILEKDKYTVLKIFSDLAGVDIEKHGNDPNQLVRKVRDWLLVNDLGKADAPTKIWDTFTEFWTDFYAKREKAGYVGEDIENMPIPEYITYAKEWLAERH